MSIQNLVSIPKMSIGENPRYRFTCQGKQYEMEQATFYWIGCTEHPGYFIMEREAVKLENTINNLRQQISAIPFSKAETVHADNIDFHNKEMRELESIYESDLKILNNYERNLSTLRHNASVYQKGIQNHIDAELTAKIEKLKEQCTTVNEQYMQVMQEIEVVEQDLEISKQLIAENEATMGMQKLSINEIEEHLQATTEEHQKKAAQREAFYAAKCKCYKEERAKFFELFSTSQASVFELSQAVALQRSYSSVSSCYSSDGEGA